MRNSRISNEERIQNLTNYIKMTLKNIIEKIEII